MPTKTRRPRFSWRDGPSRTATISNSSAASSRRLVRDLLLINVDPSRLTDAELAPESERESLEAIGKRFSRDDLLRAFDVIARAETEIRASAQPRYHFEMALLRWIHLRKLVPIEEVIANLQRGGGGALGAAGGAGSSGRSAAPTLGSGSRSASAPARPTFGSGSRPDFPRKPGGPQATLARIQEVRSSAVATAKAAAIETAVPDPVSEARDLPADLRDRFLTELQRAKATFYGMVVSQAQTVECDGRRLLFTFAPANEHLRAQVEARKGELESIAQQIAGARVPIVTMRGVAPSPERGAPAPLMAAPPAPVPDADLRTRALADEHVRALLEIFPAEITRSGRDFMNIQQMMKQAQQMQERLQKQMAELRVEASAGGGMVTVVVNGAKQIQSIKIDPEVVSKDDVEMLQDLIVAALNDAYRKADERAAEDSMGRHARRPEAAWYVSAAPNACRFPNPSPA